jgi:hypothetical protein
VQREQGDQGQSTFVVMCTKTNVRRSQHLSLTRPAVGCGHWRRDVPSVPVSTAQVASASLVPRPTPPYPAAPACSVITWWLPLAMSFMQETSYCIQRPPTAGDPRGGWLAGWRVAGGAGGGDAARVMRVRVRVRDEVCEQERTSRTFETETGDWRLATGDGNGESKDGRATRVGMSRRSTPGRRNNPPTRPGGTTAPRAPGQRQRQDTLRLGRKCRRLANQPRVQQCPLRRVGGRTLVGLCAAAAGCA